MLLGALRRSFSSMSGPEIIASLSFLDIEPSPEVLDRQAFLPAINAIHPALHLKLERYPKFRLFFTAIRELGSLLTRNLAITMLPFNNLSAKIQY
jgi:hypothetical protein